MYTSVTSINMQPDKVSQFIDAYRGIAQSMSGVEGLQGARLLTNSETGKILILGMWDSEANARAFETSPTFAEALGRLKEALTGPPTREYYETSFQIDYS